MFLLLRSWNSLIYYCIVYNICYCQYILISFQRFIITYSPLPQTLTPRNYRSFYCLHSFIFLRMSYNWFHIVCSFFRWLLSLNNMHLLFLHGFHDLIGYFFLAPHNSPLSGCTTIYPFTYLRTSWFIPTFGNCGKTDIDIHVQVLNWCKLLIFWINTKNSSNWIM